MARTPFPRGTHAISTWHARHFHVARLRDPFGELDGVGDGRGKKDVTDRVRQQNHHLSAITLGCISGVSRVYLGRLKIITLPDRIAGVSRLFLGYISGGGLVTSSQTTPRSRSRI